jgi:hypothetical protein
MIRNSVSSERARVVCLCSFGVLVLTSACSGRAVNPVAPQAGSAPDTVDGERLVAHALSDTHGHVLTAVSGSGTGIVNVTATAEPVAGTDRGFGFSVEGEVNVHDAAPNTTFLIQRKPDFNVNGICEGPAFITVPIPRPGPLVTLTTSAGGAGAAHFSVQFPTKPDGTPFPDGTRFDVMFRLLESSPNPAATELRTECFTVTTQ